MRLLLWCCFGIYLFAVLWYTVLRRSAGYYPGRYEFLWSYHLWFAGEWEYGKAILANIVMFIPFGFLMTALREGTGGKKRLLWVLLMSLAFSLLIETMQFALMRGSFEFDDLCNNVSGAFLGALLFRLSKRLLSEKILHVLLCGAGAGVVLLCFALFVFGNRSESGSLLPLSRAMCFQIEEASLANDRLEISGVCFWYSQNTADYTIILQSAQTKKRYALHTECGLPRPDVAAYFNRDDLKAGFHATVQDVDMGEEYEIILDFGFFRAISTGVYLSIEQDTADASARQASVNIHYVSKDVLLPLEAEGTDLDSIIKKGILLVYNPEYHVYVYSREGSLYWIADKGFYFEEDGSTCLVVVLWTTETEKLSEKSLAEGKRFDSFGVFFERNELQGDFGRYRVCAWEMPVNYPIIAIRTGHYNKGWIWQELFRPVFDFTAQ
ncbi:MAG: VanZ family protein [Clostridia bacterium]|nr:VanZ family protein [Clostridia bacterium]